MSKAPREDQLKLLDIAELDAQIAKLKKEDTSHPLRSQVGELMNFIAENSCQISANATALDIAQRELDAFSQQVDEIGSIIRAKEALYEAGTGMDSRGLLTLQHEIDQARAKLDQASDAEFEKLEEVEHLDTERAGLESERAELNHKMLEGRVELENAVTDIQASMMRIQAQRDALYNSLDAVLRREYERAASSGGYAVIGLHPNGMSTGGVQLSPIEVNHIKNSDPETIWFSEDYDCIVVLLDK